MRIGELSRRTGISIRMLRYYEERGLLSPERAPSGYRHYRESDLARASLVSSLIRSGLTTKLIIPLLRDDQLDRPAVGGPENGDDELTALFTAELARLESRIMCMTVSRDAVARHLRRLRGAPLAAGGGGS
ncbi:MerR family transcriptional regulator [Solwaraspora sp. WMMD1047]|uniref:MerR family transcriptional regulator n=1 Tax=Solwaraspora sp. WMMD1047 TaxID=3016102 RepID=UPI00241653B6|nr:MerR family transcriptional regulator [Solwaraspora sp. WMMD1047]MDG4832668.1 MerR family transcriptional regulator [Solwaraspora sp. WMMD1047]